MGFACGRSLGNGCCVTREAGVKMHNALQLRRIRKDPVGKYGNLRSCERYTQESFHHLPSLTKSPHNSTNQREITAFSIWSKQSEWVLSPYYQLRLHTHRSPVHALAMAVLHSRRALLFKVLIVPKCPSQVAEIPTMISNEFYFIFNQRRQRDHVPSITETCGQYQVFSQYLFREQQSTATLRSWIGTQVKSRGREVGTLTGGLQTSLAKAVTLPRGLVFNNALLYCIRSC